MVLLLHRIAASLVLPRLHAKICDKAILRSVKVYDPTNRDKLSDLDSTTGLRVGDHQHRGGSIENAAEGPAEGLRVKRRKALVEDDDGCILEERPGNVEAASFAVGELPTRLAD